MDTAASMNAMGPPPGLHWLSNALAAPAQLRVGDTVLVWLSCAGLSRALASQWLRHQLDHLPCLADGWQESAHGPRPRRPDLRLSVSYGHQRALIAVHAGQYVGVDLLALPVADDWPGVSRVFLGHAETARLLALPTEQQADGFATAWVGLEARSKALQQGLEADSAERAARHAGLRTCCWQPDPGHWLALCRG